MVEFPVHGLDMGKYVINKNHGPAVYDLVAVSNHYGGMGGGHCKFKGRRFYFHLLTTLPLYADTAFGKNKDDGKWHYFDDSSVTSSSEDAVVVSQEVDSIEVRVIFLPFLPDQGRLRALLPATRPPRIDRQAEQI